MVQCVCVCVCVCVCEHVYVSRYNKLLNLSCPSIGQLSVLSQRQKRKKEKSVHVHVCVYEDMKVGGSRPLATPFESCG